MIKQIMIIMKKFIFIFIVFNFTFCSFNKEYLMKSYQSKNNSSQISNRFNLTKGFKKQTKYLNQNSTKKNLKKKKESITILEKISENEILPEKQISIFLKECGNTKETVVKPTTSVGVLKQYIIKNASVPFENEDIILKYNNKILEDCFKLDDYKIIENSIIDFMITPTINLEAIKRNINFYLDIILIYADKLEENSKLKVEIKDIIRSYRKTINERVFKNPFKQKRFIENCEYFNFVNEFMFGLSRYFNVLETRISDENIIKSLYLRNESIQKDLKICNDNLNKMNNYLRPSYMSNTYYFKLDKHFLSSSKDRLEKFIKDPLIQYNNSFNDKIKKNSKISKNYVNNKLIKLRDLKNQMEIEYRISKYTIIGVYLINEYKKFYFHFLIDFKEIRTLRIEIIDLIQKNKKLLGQLCEINNF